MTEEMLYAKVGRLQVANDNLLGEYGRLLRLLDQVKRGETNAAAIEIDLAGNSWAINPDCPGDDDPTDPFIPPGPDDSEILVPAVG